MHSVQHTSGRQSLKQVNVTFVYGPFHIFVTHVSQMVIDTMHSLTSNTNVVHPSYNLHLI